MRLTIQLKLTPTPAQAALLRQTLHAANAACDAISQAAWNARTFRQFDIHRLCYHAIRDTFALSAQLTVRCIAKVADAYTLDKKAKRMFAPLGAVAFDARILSYGAVSVSIWTLEGRQTIPFVCGERQQAMLAQQKGETDLVFKHGVWYLFTTCEIACAEPQDADDVLGIDLGVTNIATDSDGVVHQARTIKNVRYRHRSLRQKLQKKGTLGSRRRLRKLSGQERRFATWVNHTLSKQIVAKAERTKRAIAPKDLTHIRTRIRAKRSQRATRRLVRLPSMHVFFPTVLFRCRSGRWKADKQFRSRRTPYLDPKGNGNNSMVLKREASEDVCGERQQATRCAAEGRKPVAICVSFISTKLSVWYLFTTCEIAGANHRTIRERGRRGLPLTWYRSTTRRHEHCH